MGYEKSRRPIAEPGASLFHEENRTGKFWVDGKPIFTKAVATGALPNAGSTDTPHGISNIGEVIGIIGAAKDPTGPEWMSLPNGNIRLTVDDTNIVVAASGDQTAYTSSVVIVEFTKA